MPNMIRMDIPVEIQVLYVFRVSVTRMIISNTARKFMIYSLVGRIES